MQRMAAHHAAPAMLRGFVGVCTCIMAIAGGPGKQHGSSTPPEHVDDAVQVVAAIPSSMSCAASYDATTFSPSQERARDASG